MSHISMSHVTHINESCHTHEWCAAHYFIISVHVAGLCVTWLDSHDSFTRMTCLMPWLMTWPWHMNKCSWWHDMSCELQCVAVCSSAAVCCSMTHDIWISVRDDMTCHAYEDWLMTWHDSFIRVTWPIGTGSFSKFPRDSFMTPSYVWHDTCDMTPSYVWHDSFIRVTWLIHTCDMTRPIWLIHTCDMTHSYVWHDSCISVAWLIHTCDMTHLHVGHDSCIRVTWLIYMCDMTHENTCDMTRLIHTCDMTHSYGWHDSWELFLSVTSHMTPLYV